MSEQTLFPQPYRVVLLAGGVGGARLADGLCRLLPPAHLTIIGNTGDDFTHWGLTICPDLDTVMYALAGVANAETGWGRAGDSWRTLQEVERLGGPGWFRLGDLDLATHLVRSQLLAEGRTLTEVTRHLCRHYGLGPALLPMSDQAAPTLVETDAGILPFQEWFVHRHWQPACRQVHLPPDVRATAPVVRALEQADLVIIAPSNPFVSVDTILNVYPIRTLIGDLPRLVVAVSPIIGGNAVKGPAAKMMREMGLEPGPATVAAHYGELVDLFVYDQVDGPGLDLPQPFAYATDTLMATPDDRRRLAWEILAEASRLLAA